MHEKGESILICNKPQRHKVERWFEAGNEPISSFLLSTIASQSWNTFGKVKVTAKVFLDLIASRIDSKKAIAKYFKFTLCYSQHGLTDFKTTLKDSLKYLLSNNFIEESKPLFKTSDVADNVNTADQQSYSLSDIGSATAWSNISPEEALALYQHLTKKKGGKLHQIYYLYLVNYNWS